MNTAKRLTVKNPDKQTYRLPMREGYTFRQEIQMERAVLYGSVINMLGAYEELGTVEEIKAKLDELERRKKKSIA